MTNQIVVVVVLHLNSALCLVIRDMAHRKKTDFFYRLVSIVLFFKLFNSISPIQSQMGLLSRMIQSNVSLNKLGLI